MKDLLDNFNILRVGLTCNVLKAVSPGFVKEDFDDGFLKMVPNICTSFHKHSRITSKVVGGSIIRFKHFRIVS